jgi:hypothetical protein
MGARLRMVARMGVSTALVFAPWAPWAARVAMAFQPPPQTEFVPVKDLPAAEAMPAAPLLIAAYAFFLVAVMFYLWTIWRRLNKVETEIRMLEKSPTAQGRPATSATSAGGSHTS